MYLVLFIIVVALTLTVVVVVVKGRPNLFIFQLLKKVFEKQGGDNKIKRAKKKRLG
jgi:hypothetical protein